METELLFQPFGFVCLDSGVRSIVPNMIGLLSKLQLGLNFGGFGALSNLSRICSDRFAANKFICFVSISSGTAAK